MFQRVLFPIVTLLTSDPAHCVTQAGHGSACKISALSVAISLKILARIHRIYIEDKPSLVGCSVTIPVENREFSIMAWSIKMSHKLLNCYVAETTPTSTSTTTTVTTPPIITTTATSPDNAIIVRLRSH